MMPDIMRVLQCSSVMAEHIEADRAAYQAKFGDQLRLARLERRLTQDQLAERAGLHRTYIGHLERGRCSPTLATLERLARALDLDDIRELLP